MTKYIVDVVFIDSSQAQIRGVTDYQNFHSLGLHEFVHIKGEMLTMFIRMSEIRSITVREQK